jgi:hypothetical protein
MRSWAEAGIQLSEFPHVDESSRGGSARGRKLAQGELNKKMNSGRRGLDEDEDERGRKK